MPEADDASEHCHPISCERTALDAQSRVEVCGQHRAEVACEDRPVELTGFDDLDELLAEFVARVRDALGDLLVGVYLQGSFALRAGDEWSDVDFIVAIKEPLTGLDSLNQLHADLYELPTEWAKHLEGSYIPVSLLRQVDPDRTPVPFLDNGATRLELDPHCNSAVVRWILRQHAVTLFGPPAGSLVDRVSADDLRREARDALLEYRQWSVSLTTMSAWAQPYLVLTVCRLLRTIECGDVTTKAIAGSWAATRLPAWEPLIERALEVRPNPWNRVRQFADPDAIRETQEFARDISELYSSSAQRP